MGGGWWVVERMSVWWDVKHLHLGPRGFRGEGGFRRILRRWFWGRVMLYSRILLSLAVDHGTVSGRSQSCAGLVCRCEGERSESSMGEEDQRH